MRTFWERLTTRTGSQRGRRCRTWNVLGPPENRQLTDDLLCVNVQAPPNRKSSFSRPKIAAELEGSEICSRPDAGVTLPCWAAATTYAIRRTVTRTIDVSPRGTTGFDLLEADDRKQEVC